MKKKAKESRNPLKPLTKRDMKKRDFLIALRSKFGNISSSCEAIGIKRQTYYDWFAADAEFRKAANEVFESLIDFTESKLLQRISENDVTAMIFFLKCKAKHRGYIDRQEIDHRGEVGVFRVEFDGKPPAIEQAAQAIIEDIENGADEN